MTGGNYAPDLVCHTLRPTMNNPRAAPMTGAHGNPPVRSGAPQISTDLQPSHAPSGSHATAQRTHLGPAAKISVATTQPADRRGRSGCGTLAAIAIVVTDPRLR